MNKRMDDIINLALNNGLDPFPVVFETIEKNTMNNIVSYGLPSRARHWSYGRAYDYIKLQGEMGYSKMYEVVLNNNPSYAFMLDTNTEIQNIFIAAHVSAHSDFFKNNYMFKKTDRNMIYHAAEHAGRIDQYIEKYGFEKVEHLMDIGFALDDHIDWHKGLNRKPYDGNIIPAHPEKDLLWFFINYAPLEEWEKDVLDIIREESYYFYPQKMRKISNEGWASYWHAELMYQTELSSHEYLDFVETHEKVVQPGTNPFRINPYYLGFKIFKDIEKRWDRDFGAGEGRKKIFEVRAEEDDISFIRNYLTSELIDELNLFTYGYARDYAPDYSGEKLIEIKDRMREEVVECLVRPLYNGGAPKIVVAGIGSENSLILKHDSEEMGEVDHNFAKKTIEYIWDLWSAPIELHVKDKDNSELAICYDEAGSYIKKIDREYDFFE